VRGGWLPWLALAACGGGDRLGACPGERPAIADCYVGEFFADCGGTGDEPVLGCDDQGRCLWFTGGCAPDGYDGSSCGSDNVCCHEDWPFDDERGSNVGQLLAAFGTAGWDRTTATNVSVTVDTTLTGSATTISCTPFDSSPNYTPCNDAAPVISAFQTGTTVITAGSVQGNRAGGWYMWIEIVDDGAGALGGRVCEAWYTHVPDYCYPHSITCATSGTVTINQLPIVDVRQLVANVDVQLGSLHVVATLVGML
jgi:hypothetical protein